MTKLFGGIGELREKPAQGKVERRWKMMSHEKEREKERGGGEG